MNMNDAASPNPNPALRADSVDRADSNVDPASIDRVSPTLRESCPRSRAMVQSWRDLLFVHWEVPLSLLRPLVPPALSIDTFEGRAFLGLVPFTMRGIRLSYLPPVPGTTAFHETNLRTYVHRRGRDPGVWFFSLDAANALAVKVARAFFHLPYFKARMRMSVQNTSIEYASERMWPEPVPASIEARWTIGEALGPSVPGTLQHFFLERYILYAKAPNGALHLGRIHHAPYPARAARLDHLRESLSAAAGLGPLRDPMSILFSPGVDVDVFALEAITP